MVVCVVALMMFIMPMNTFAQTSGEMKPEDWIIVDGPPPTPPTWCMIPGTMIPYPCSWTN